MIFETVRLGLRTFAVSIGLFAAIFIAAFAALKVFPAFSFGGKPTILAQGAGLVEVQPDKVQVSGAVTTSAKSAADALDENNAILARILEGLKADGIGRDKIRTTGFSITPQHPALGRDSYDTNQLITSGYVVKNSINVILPVGQYSGKLLDRMIRLGATNIDAVSFVVDDAPRYNEQARTLAARDARAKAEVAAKALGLRVGRVVSVDRREMEGYPTEVYPAAARVASNQSGPTIEIIAREQSFAAAISVVFELE